MAGKLGKLPFQYDKKDLKLRNYLTALPPLPSRRFGFGTIFTSWGSLGNNGASNCVFAGADHETMLYNKLAGHPVTFSAQNALSDYSIVTCYDGTDATDNGTNVRDAMAYRKNSGVVDTSLNKHKIDAYVQIPAKSWNLMLRCVWTFGAVGIGFEVPSSAITQYDQNAVWSDVGDNRIVGGHYVPIVGSMSPTMECSSITWGSKQRMTKGFYQKYNDEAWVPLSREQMLAAGYNIRHIDWEALKSDLASL